MSKFKPKYVEPKQLSNLAMTTGGEEKFSVVLDMGLIKKRWVGIGWVEEGIADAEDMRKYPIVRREFKT